MLLTSFWLATALQLHAVTPQQLQRELMQPTAQLYQQRIHTLAQQKSYNDELASLRTDPLLSEPAREYLLQQSLQALQTHTENESLRTYVISLSGYQEKSALKEDFEGRTRHIPLTHIANHANALLAHWQSESLAQTYTSQLSRLDWSQLIKRWPELTATEQRAWLKAISSASASSFYIDAQHFHSLAQTATELAITLCEKLESPALFAALLQNENGAELVSYLNHYPHWLSKDFFYHELVAPQKYAPVHHGQVMQLAAKADHSHLEQWLWNKALGGDASALFALTEQQGNRAITRLEKAAQQKEWGQAKMGVQGLRMLNTEEARHALKTLAQNPALSNDVQKELAPWK